MAAAALPILHYYAYRIVFSLYTTSLMYISTDVTEFRFFFFAHAHARYNSNMHKTYVSFLSIERGLVASVLTA